MKDKKREELFWAEGAESALAVGLLEFLFFVERGSPYFSSSLIPLSIIRNSRYGVKMIWMSHQLFTFKLALKGQLLCCFSKVPGSLFPRYQVPFFQGTRFPF